MSSAKRHKGASNSHNLTVVEKLLIIHSIYGNAAKCLRFYGPLPVWCALNRNKYSEEQGELSNENNGWLFQYPHEWLYRRGTLVSLGAHDVRTLDQEEGYSMKNTRVSYKNCMK